MEALVGFSPMELRSLCIHELVPPAYAAERVFGAASMVALLNSSLNEQLALHDALATAALPCAVTFTLRRYRVQ